MRGMGRQQTAWLLLLGMGACRFDSAGVAPPDGVDAMAQVPPVHDAAVLDAPVRDALLPDALVPDAAPRDGMPVPDDAPPGPDDWALRFDGVDDFFRIDREVQADFTIEAWIRTTSSRSGTQFFEGLGLFYADIRGTHDDFGAAILNGRFAFGTGDPDTTVQSLTQVTTGQWVHVAAVRTRSTGTIQVFVNGNLEASADTASQRNLGDPDDIDIGSNNVDSGRAFRGDIDELRVWDTARTAAELQAAMNLRLAGDEPGLVGYWRMDDGPGATAVVDSGPRGNHGSLGAGAAGSSPTFIPSDAPVD